MCMINKTHHNNGVECLLIHAVIAYALPASPAILKQQQKIKKTSEN